MQYTRDIYTGTGTIVHYQRFFTGFCQFITKRQIYRALKWQKFISFLSKKKVITYDRGSFSCTNKFDFRPIDDFSITLFKSIPFKPSGRKEEPR